MKTFNLKGNTKEDLDNFLINNQREVWNLILEAIENCVENGLDEQQIFELSPPIDKLFVFRSSFKTTLEKGLIVFEELEEYEQCAKCKKIIDTLEY